MGLSMVHFASDAAGFLMALLFVENHEPLLDHGPDTVCAA